MDRNSTLSPSGVLQHVALRKESVDRNIPQTEQATPPRVALRKESVDRNFDIVAWDKSAELSLSARRAWIEIT